MRENTRAENLLHALVENISPHGWPQPSRVCVCAKWISRSFAMFVNLMSVLGMARKLFVTQFAISFMIIPFRTPTPHNSTTNLHKRSRRQTQPLSNDRRRRPAVSLPVSDISCAHASEMVYDIPITAPVPHRPPPAPPHVDRMQCSDRIMDGNCPDRTNRTPGRTDAHYRPVAGPAERAPAQNGLSWHSAFLYLRTAITTHVRTRQMQIRMSLLRRVRGVRAPKFYRPPLSRLQFTGFELGALGFWGAARLSGCRCHKRPAAKPGTRVVCWRGLFITVLSRMRLSRPTHAYTRTSARLLCAFVCG